MAQLKIASALKELVVMIVAGFLAEFISAENNIEVKSTPEV